MTHIIVDSAVAPMMREPNPRMEVISQMVLGETGLIREEQRDWLLIRREFDGYEGWVHRGYLRMSSADAVAIWRDRATHRSLGARLRDGRRMITTPLLARLAPAGAGWELPSGWSGSLESGSILLAGAVAQQAVQERTIDWARAQFEGSAYQWGGITPWGVDCSGLIQTTFAVRGIVLPRDSADQATRGNPGTLDTLTPGDLLFFSESGGKVTHVAFAGDEETLVHSTLSCGGFIVESWRPGTRAARLRDHLVAVRRVPDGPLP